MATPTGRLRTAMDPAKAFRQYDELRRTKRLKRALIIAETTDGNYQVLAQMTDAPGAAGLCMVAAEALAKVPEELRGGEAPKPSPASPPPVMTRALAPPVHTIAAAWADFDQSVLPDSAGPVQRREMRRSFYAGAHTLMATICNMLEAGDDMTPADFAKMDALNNELVRYATDLQEGRA